ncbi:MAG TPA: hypothetical protein DCR44_06035 [Acholeplasmatales bacterium]|nr:MAG: hypothetical protein A2Y16_00430 [Tenericutes bacterium GWF2_57_13]HAQ56938.1 hypothetical protein [Acholeplasmatales bacterium]
MIKTFFNLVWSDLKRLWSYRIVLFIMVLTFLFSLAIILFPVIDPTNFIYVSIFILPVVVFSISLFIDREEGTLLPFVFSPLKSGFLVFSKVLSALAVMTIPIVCFIIAMAIAQYEISFLLLFLAYMLGALLHILIGISLSIISKTTSVLSLSYVAYIVVFSLTAILYSNGIIPLRFQYYLIISPAYLSGVLIDNIVAGCVFSEVWLLILAVGLQLAYGVLLSLFIIIPYFKQYVIATEQK